MGMGVDARLTAMGNEYDKLEYFEPRRLRTEKSSAE